MANIIDQIIEIDEIAQKQLDEASKIKELYMKELKDKENEVNNFLEKKTTDRIRKLTETEIQLAEEQKAKITADNKIVLEHLEAVYNKNHEKLEQEIFHNVVGM